MTIKYEAAVDKLITLLPSFYKEFLYDDKFIRVLFDSYIDVIGFLTRYAKSIYNNSDLENIEYYRNIEFSVLPLKNALYDIKEVANKFAEEGYGDWFDDKTSLATKVEFLSKLTHYELLDTKRSWDQSNNEILTLKVCKNFSQDTINYVNAANSVLDTVRGIIPEQSDLSNTQLRLPEYLSNGTNYSGYFIEINDGQIRKITSCTTNLSEYIVNVDAPWTTLPKKNDYVKIYKKTIGDFLVKDNKLFVFNDLAKFPLYTNNPKLVLLKDIIIDAKKVQNKWGDLIGISKPDFISYSEYNTIVKNIITSFVNGPTIKILKSITSSITDNLFINFYDKYSKDLPIFYKNFFDSGEFNEFDFAIELPVNILNITSKKDYIRQILDIIKPAYSNYVLYYLYKEAESDIFPNVESHNSFSLLNTLEQDFIFAEYNGFKLNTGILNNDKFGFVCLITKLKELINLNLFKKQSEIKNITDTLMSYSLSVNRAINEVKNLPIIVNINDIQKFSSETTFNIDFSSAGYFNNTSFNSYILGVPRYIDSSYYINIITKNASEKYINWDFQENIFWLNSNFLDNDFLVTGLILPINSVVTLTKVNSDTNNSPIDAVRGYTVNPTITEFKFGTNLGLNSFSLNTGVFNTSQIGMTYTLDNNVISFSSVQVSPRETKNISEILNSYSSFINKINTDSKSIPVSNSFYNIEKSNLETKFGVSFDGFTLNSGLLNDSYLGVNYLLERNINNFNNVNLLSSDTKNISEILNSYSIISSKVNTEIKPVPVSTSTSIPISTANEMRFGVSFDGFTLNSGLLNDSYLGVNYLLDRNCSGSITLTRDGTVLQTISF